MRALLILLGLIASISTALAEDLLYQVVLDSPARISDTSQLKAALQTVANRLKPGENDFENPVIQAADPAGLLEPATRKSLTQAPQTTLRFDPQAINQLMENAGQQPWIKTRPKILTWIIDIRDARQELVRREDAPQIYDAVESAARAKALTLYYPNEQTYQAAQTWGSRRRMPNRYTLENLTEISESMGMKPEAVLYISFHGSMDRPNTTENWHFLYRGNIGSNYSHVFTKSAQAGALTMAGVSDFLFSQGEKKPLPSTMVYVNISNVLSAPAYEQLTESLAQIPGVVKASVNSVTTDAVLYTLEITIPQALLDLRLSKKYTALPNQPEEGIMNYRLKL